MLEDAGYARRALVGKWHLGQASREFHPLSHGFTHFYGHLTGAITYFSHHREGALDWHRDFRISHDEGYTTDLIAGEAVRQIEPGCAEEPFFLYVAFNAPHRPLAARDEDRERYPELPERRRTYAAMVDALDRAISRILAALDEKGIAGRTFVLFASDNGADPPGDNRPLRGGKSDVYEGGIRVPAIVRWPDGVPGPPREVRVPVGYIDVYPTLKRVAGATAPDPRPLDGRDVLDVIRGDALFDPRDHVGARESAGEAEPGSPAAEAPEKLARLTARYDGEIRFADAAVGRLVEGLEERGLLGETVLVLTADHGEELHDHGGWHHGHTVYEELLRVPLILAGAGLPRGIRVREPVQLIDVAPTILELAGAAPGRHVPGTASARPRHGTPDGAAGRGAVHALHPAAAQGGPDQGALQAHRRAPRIHRRQGRAGRAVRPAERPGGDAGSRPRGAERASSLRARLRAWMETIPTRAAGAHEPLSAEDEAGLRELGYVE